MSTLKPLLSLIDAYIDVTGTTDASLSLRAFNDGKRIPALRRGADLTTRRLDQTIAWFSANWPENAEWPDGVDRPAVRRHGDSRVEAVATLQCDGCNNPAPTSTK